LTGSYLVRGSFACLRWFFIGAWLCGLLSFSLGAGYAQAQEQTVHVLEISGVINPPVANYLNRALSNAAAQKARLVVIKLDTPGGLDTSMRLMTQAILASPVPVAVYVTPPGARAASAGLFILAAAHVAAMAPSTNTGAAHPVGLGGNADDVAAAKAVNDAAATIRALARERGRNAAWVEQAVRESVSVTEQEALELKVIDLVAEDLDDLLRQIDGRTIQTAAGPVTLEAATAPRNDVPMTLAERILHVISDPNIAFILLSVGSIGIIAELYNPGALIPGIAGVISLILAFFSLGNLPTNWAGVALIILATVLLIAELNTEGIGILGVGALVAFFLGGLMLFQPFSPESPALPDLRVSPWLLGVVTAGMGAFIFMVLAQVIRARRAPLLTGREQFAGQTAQVRETLNPRGRVRFGSQIWFAEVRTGQVVPAGETVRIVDVEGLTLIVEPIAAYGVMD
jgi:membrane-bound serine protease (ClpP class)